jgi:hypothetical protein
MSIIVKEIVRIWINTVQLLEVVELPVVFFPVWSTASSCTAAVSGNNIKRV